MGHLNSFSASGGDVEASIANKSGGRYPFRTLYNIVCGLKLLLVVKNGEGALNPLAVSGKR